MVADSRKAVRWSSGSRLLKRGASRLLGATLLLGAALWLGGCGRPPVVETANLKLVASLRTACSARNPEWLTGVEKAVDERQAEGELSEAAHRHFKTLIEQARAGEWEAAERACLEFERAQSSRRR